MRLKRIYEDSNLASLHAVIREEVTFKAICLRISGTNGATAATLADIGRVQYIKNGQMIIDAGFDFLHAMAHIIGGNPYDNTTNSGALNFFLPIPRRLFDDNVEHCSPSDDAQIKITFNANLATRVASAGKVQVFLDLEEGVQKYDLVMRQYSETIAGAGVRPMAFAQDNISMALLSATVSGVITTASSAISEVSHDIGNLGSADSELSAIVEHTNSMFNLESDFALACVPYFANGDITSRLFDDFSIRVTTTGASTPEVLLLSANFQDKKLELTARKQQQRILDFERRKVAKRDSVTPAVVRRITNLGTVS